MENLTFLMTFLMQCQRSELNKALAQETEDHIWCAVEHRLEKKNARETVRQAQEEAETRRRRVAAMRAAEVKARKASAYPDATRVFAKSFPFPSLHSFSLTFVV